MTDVVQNECIEYRLAVMKIFVKERKRTKSSGSESRCSLLPSDCFFDLLGRDAIFGGKVTYGFPGVESRHDHSSRDTRTGDHGFAEAYGRAHLDQLWLSRPRFHHEGIKLKQATRIPLHALQIEFHHSGDQDLMIPEIHDIPQMLDKQLAAIGVKACSISGCSCCTYRDRLMRALRTVGMRTL
jgi:hypothetical protein